MIENKTNRISQFQGLRAVAFLAIFISHANVGPFGALGAWGVSVFFVLSGFLMMYSYLPREKSPKFGFNFAWIKIKKLYLLHIAMMLVAVLYKLIDFKDSISKLLVDILLHSTLVQAWIPYSKYYSTLNGLAWFLCVSFFLYLCFPVVLKLFYRFKKTSTVFFSLIVFFAIQILISIFAMVYGNVDKHAFFSMQWITYYCPLTRLIDFLIGCCLGFIFLKVNQQESGKKVRYIFFEILTIVLIIFSLYCYINKMTVLGTEYVKYSLLFTPTTVALIWLVSRNRGIISKALQTNVLVKIGDKSPYTFLIHGLVIKVCNLVIPKVITGIPTLIVAFIALLFTFIAAYIWVNFEEKVLLRKK